VGISTPYLSLLLLRSWKRMMFPCSMPDTLYNLSRLFTRFNYACELHEITSDGRGNMILNVILRCVRVTVVAVGGGGKQ
jgi:hypothetical protein